MSSLLGHAAPFQRHHGLVSIVQHARACLAAGLRYAAALARAIETEAAHRGQLRASGELDNHLLRDIGVSREDVARVCGKKLPSE
ncbi:MAG TPA: DUF1127 domain-containing protein [Beijerinckiaceae bacterium]|nr:DUF1127 domain-containing protein [Beijerinckiaceae bacterium]